MKRNQKTSEEIEIGEILEVREAGISDTNKLLNKGWFLIEVLAKKTEQDGEVAVYVLGRK